jgi:alkylation response protein AidB-like acyl-CoA dehydrogenase
MEGPAPVSQQGETTTQPRVPAGASDDGANQAGTGTHAGADRAAAVGTRLPDLTYSDQETELRSAVRSVLADKAAWPAVLAGTETPHTYDTGLWRTLAAEIGCAGLLVPEPLGGAGASFREAAVVAEEIGRALAPVPFLGSAVIATVALLSAATAGGAEDAAASGPAATLIAGLAAGTTTAALAVPFAMMPGSRTERTVRVGPPPDQGSAAYQLTGAVAGVADALPADVLLVPADGVPFGLYVVPVADSGVTVAPVTSLDMTRQLADISLAEASATRIAAGPAAEQAIAAALRAGAAMLAAEQLGLADQALEVTVAYVKQRHAFGRPVGSFQAIKHRLADLWVSVVQARAASRYAAACLADGDADAQVAVALAKGACSDTALLAGQEMVQLHGGIGFTWEHPAHLYLKRAKADSIALGTADRHRASLAALVDLPPAPAS